MDTAPAGGRPLTPENLAADFGPRAATTGAALDALARSLDAALSAERSAVRGSFARWATLVGPEDGARRLFCLHTYFAFVVKASAATILTRGGGQVVVGAATPRHLRKRLAALESGHAFAEHGFTGLPGDDIFSWYLDAWDDTLAAALGDVVEHMSVYQASVPAGPEGRPRDMFKALYTALVPREDRHARGEHYTPDWLVRRTLSLLDPGLFPADGVVSRDLAGRVHAFRFLDPSCGSGTFLLAVIGRILSVAETLGLPPGETLRAVSTNVTGLDLNPVAVLTARVNIALSILPLLPHRRGPISIPVHNVDTLRIAEQSSGDSNATLGSFRFGLIAGNPPWINWESLPEETRRGITPAWQRYGLFPHRGMDTILGKGKKDVSALMLYVVADRLLDDSGRMALVMTQSVLKTSGAGQGFRRFLIPGIGAPDVPLRVLHVDDMVELQPFDGASNRTAVMLIEKGTPTCYPVSYTLWRKGRAPGGGIRRDCTYADAMGTTVRHDMGAEPVNPADRTSSWLTGRPRTVAAVRRYLGRSPYDAHLGANTGGANAVYWLRVTGERANGSVAVENVREGAKIVVEPVMARVEDAVVYPLLRAHDVGRWRAHPHASILFVQDPAAQRGIEPERLARESPRACAYLGRFETVLRARAAYRRYFTRTRRGVTVDTGPFYSLFDVGTYTVAEWKVVWTRLSRIEAAAIGPLDGKPVIPQETLTLVACNGPEEAWYLSGMLNSVPFQLAACSYSQTGGKSMGSPHLLEYIRVPRWDSGVPAHRGLAELSRQAHVRTAAGGYVGALEERIDETSAAIFGLDGAELALLREDLRDLYR